MESNIKCVRACLSAMVLSTSNSMNRLLHARSKPYITANTRAQYNIFARSKTLRSEVDAYLDECYVVIRRGKVVKALTCEEKLAKFKVFQDIFVVSLGEAYVTLADGQVLRRSLEERMSPYILCDDSDRVIGFSARAHLRHYLGDTKRKRVAVRALKEHDVKDVAEIEY